MPCHSIPIEQQHYFYCPECNDRVYVADAGQHFHSMHPANYDRLCAEFEQAMKWYLGEVVKRAQAKKEGEAK